MRRVCLQSLLLGAALALCANAQNDAGFTPEWDMRAVLKDIAAHAKRLVPMLDKVNPGAWAAKGAPEAYQAQWKSTRAQAEALAGDALELSANPEKLPAALKTFFRMQSIEFSVASLAEGVRRYQNPALAEMLTGVAGENGANRERFQRYIVDLAAQREQEYQVMDYEAQRCRGILAKQPPAAKKSGKK